MTFYFNSTHKNLSGFFKFLNNNFSTCYSVSMTLKGGPFTFVWWVTVSKSCALFSTNHNDCILHLCSTNIGICNKYINSLYSHSLIETGFPPSIDITIPIGKHCMFGLGTCWVYLMSPIVCGISILHPLNWIPWVQWCICCCSRIISWWLLCT